MLAYKKEYLPNYTYDDYKHWKGDWELISGIAYAMSPAPNIIHQEINSNIMYVLKTELKKCKECKALPEVDWKINQNTIVRPDSLVVCNLQKRGAYLSQTPAIIFEVLSPSTKAKDRNLKSLIYSGRGVKYYTIVDPTEMFAEVYKLDNGNYRLQGEFKDNNYIFKLDNGCEIDFSFEDIFDI